MDPVDFDCVEQITLRSLGDALRDAGFTEPLLSKAEAIAPRRLDPVRLPVVRAWLRAQADPGFALLRLFAYGDAVRASHVDELLGAEVRTRLCEAGMLAMSDDQLTARVRIVPFCGLLLASDPMETAGDPVMGPGAFTQEMAQLMPIDPGARVLDVGSGAGSLALVAAARGASTVVGVDLHPRAASVARFNATLNGLTAEFLTSDLTAAVRDRTFDLVVAQPPFVVKPDDVAATTYLHGGAEGDEIALRLCGEVADVLAPRGRALILVETLCGPEAAAPRIGEAFGDAPIEAIVIAAPGTTFDLLSIGYASVAHPKLDAGYAATAERYFRHLSGRSTDRTLHVLVDARRVEGRRQPRAITVERASLGGMRPDDLRALEAAVELALADDATLRRARVVVPAGAELVQTQRLDDGGSELSIRWTRGGRDTQRLTDAAAVVVETARAPVGVDALVRAYAAAADAAPDEVAARVLAFVRAALGSGLLVVA